MASEIVLHVHTNDGQDWDCQCSRCGSSLTWQECESCGGEGLSHHDCGEDSCCCEDDSPNVSCDICQGRGGWNRCLSAPAWCEAHPLPDREEFKSGVPEWFVVPPPRVSRGRGTR